MSAVKHTIYVASYEFFQTREDFIAAIDTGHREIVTYEFTTPSDLDAELVNMIANGILFSHDWCSDGIYTELRFELPPTALIPTKPVPPQTSQSQLAEHMMFIVERMAIDECMTPHLIPGWDTMMRYYVRSWDDDCIVTAKEIRDRIFVTAIDKAESVTDAVAIKARLETRYIELLNMTPKDIVKLKEQPAMRT